MINLDNEMKLLTLWLPLECWAGVSWHVSRVHVSNSHTWSSVQTWHYKESKAEKSQIVAKVRLTGLWGRLWHSATRNLTITSWSVTWTRWLTGPEKSYTNKPAISKIMWSREGVVHRCYATFKQQCNLQCLLVCLHTLPRAESMVASIRSLNAKSQKQLGYNLQTKNW